MRDVVCPQGDEPVERIISALESVGLVIPYEAAGVRCYGIRDACRCIRQSRGDLPLAPLPADAQGVHALMEATGALRNVAAITDWDESDGIGQAEGAGTAEAAPTVHSASPSESIAPITNWDAPPNAGQSGVETSEIGEATSAPGKAPAVVGEPGTDAVFDDDFSGLSPTHRGVRLPPETRHKGSSGSIRFKAIEDLWNDTCHERAQMTKLNGWNEMRLKAARKLWYAYPAMQSLQGWRVYFERILRCEELVEAGQRVNGPNKGSFDWFLKLKSYEEVMSGVYDRAKQTA